MYSIIVTFQDSFLQLKCNWPGVSPKLGFRCRRIVDLALSASHMPFMQTTEIISTVTDYNTTLEFVFAFACILRK